MLQKREIFRACFDGFDYDKIAAYGEADVERILACDGMIRSRRKVEAVIQNAGHFQEIRAEFGSFSRFLWDFTGGKSILYAGHQKAGSLRKTSCPTGSAGSSRGAASVISDRSRSIRTCRRAA